MNPQDVMFAMTEYTAHLDHLADLLLAGEDTTDFEHEYLTRVETTYTPDQKQVINDLREASTTVRNKHQNQSWGVDPGDVDE